MKAKSLEGKKQALVWGPASAPALFPVNAKYYGNCIIRSVQRMSACFIFGKSRHEVRLGASPGSEALSQRWLRGNICNNSSMNLQLIWKVEFFLKVYIHL